MASHQLVASTPDALSPCQRHKPLYSGTDVADEYGVVPAFQRGLLAVRTMLIWVCRVCARRADPVEISKTGESTYLDAADGTLEEMVGLLGDFSGATVSISATSDSGTLVESAISVTD
jgi:hypothetical protein